MPTTWSSPCELSGFRYFRVLDSGRSARAFPGDINAATPVKPGRSERKDLNMSCPISRKNTRLTLIAVGLSCLAQHAQAQPGYVISDVGLILRFWLCPQSTVMVRWWVLPRDSTNSLLIRAFRTAANSAIVYSPFQPGRIYSDASARHRCRAGPAGSNGCRAMARSARMDDGDRPAGLRNGQPEI